MIIENYKTNLKEKGKLQLIKGGKFFCAVQNCQNYRQIKENQKKTKDAIINKEGTSG